MLRNRKSLFFHWLTCWPRGWLYKNFPNLRPLFKIFRIKPTRWFIVFLARPSFFSGARYPLEADSVPWDTSFRILLGIWTHWFQRIKLHPDQIFSTTSEVLQRKQQQSSALRGPEWSIQSFPPMSSRGTTPVFLYSTKIGLHYQKKGSN